MKNALTTLALLICACFVSIPVAGQGTRILQLRVELTTGERSRDSSSQTTTITVAPGTIVWEQTYGGRRGRTPPIRKKFKFSSADRKKVEKLIKFRNLLVTDSIKLPRDTSTYEYFAVSFDLTLDERKGAGSIEGPRTAVKVREEKLYQDTVALVKELYRIINRQDTSILYEELILGPPGV